MIVDSTTEVLQAALRGLAARQRAAADNVANAETPGFLATRVDFESALRAAVASGDAASVRPAPGVSADPVGPNGNNVHLDDETVALVETGLKYQMLTTAMTKRFEVMRHAIGGQ
jgi:flagellar basal-body rod protein FlgB